MRLGTSASISYLFPVSALPPANSERPALLDSVPAIGLPISKTKSFGKPLALLALSRSYSSLILDSAKRSGHLINSTILTSRMRSDHFRNEIHDPATPAQNADIGPLLNVVLRSQAAPRRTGSGRSRETATPERSEVAGHRRRPGARKTRYPACQGQYQTGG